MTDKIVLTVPEGMQSSLLMKMLQEAQLISDTVVEPKVSYKGFQAGDYLEHHYLPAGDPQRLTKELMKKAYDTGLRNIRIPANCHPRATAAGVISESYLKLLDEQVYWAIEIGFQTIMIDPLHHYNQWKGSHSSDSLLQDQTMGAWGNAEHTVRAVAMWKQLALRYKDTPLSVSFDLLNEPTGEITIDVLNNFHVLAVQAIRATGGNNAKRLVWLEPILGNACYELVIPPGGNIGFSVHNYSPIGYTHQGVMSLTPDALTSYAAEVKLAKDLAKERGVALSIGESGVIQGKNDRPEYYQFIWDMAQKEEVLTYVWALANNFPIWDKVNGKWITGMEEAIRGSATTREYIEPYAADTKNGIIVEGGGAGVTYQEGVLTLPANNGRWIRFIKIVFPNAPIKRGGRVIPEKGSNLLFQINALKKTATGTYVNALTSDGGQIKSGYRNVGGVPTMMSKDFEEGALLAAFIEQVPGSPAVSVALRAWGA